MKLKAININLNGTGLRSMVADGEGEHGSENLVKSLIFKSGYQGLKYVEVTRSDDTTICINFDHVVTFSIDENQ